MYSLDQGISVQMLSISKHNQKYNTTHHTIIIKPFANHPESKDRTG